MRFASLLLLFLFTGQAHALLSSKHSCRILIHLEKHNGESQDLQFSSALKTKEACQTLARIHQRNFDSKVLKSKKVSYHWTKTVKKIPMLAKISGKKFKKSKRLRGKNF